LFTHDIYVLSVILTINRECFPRDHQQVSLFIEMHCVYCEVGAGVLNIVWVNLILQGDKVLCCDEGVLLL